MKDRPVLVAVIGYIIGILGGLYFSFSMVLFYILMLATYYIVKNYLKKHRKRKFKLLSVYRYSRIVKYQNKQYENLYQEGENLQITGIVTSQKIEKAYYDLYQVKLLDSNPFYLYIQVNKNSEKLEYGDKIQVKGEYKKPSEQRNHGGYDDKSYLKTLKIIGRMKVNKIKIN